MRAKTILLLLIALLFTSVVSAQTRYPKREFRGAWIQCVNGQFQGMPAEKMQQLLINQLNSLQGAGINAIIFQVRAEADALYKSSYEPWSRFLTGVQGRVPSPYWDPMQFMIDECHKRGMEFHAWINPYRAKTKGTTALSPIHPYNKNPERFVNYAGQLYFDPALPENRKYICKIVRDIVTRYDVDAIHMDDYFYPYPNPGEDFPDHVSFAQYGRGYSNKADWRRDNVNVLIKEIHETVRECKPWVKFGVSPFGIYRNKKNDPNGSDTRGLQNYDDFYADVLMWINNGWVAVSYTHLDVYKRQVNGRYGPVCTFNNFFRFYLRGKQLSEGFDTCNDTSVRVTCNVDLIALGCQGIGTFFSLNIPQGKGDGSFAFFYFKVVACGTGKHIGQILGCGN